MPDLSRSKRVTAELVLRLDRPMRLLEMARCLRAFLWDAGQSLVKQGTEITIVCEFKVHAETPTDLLPLAVKGYLKRDHVGISLVELIEVEDQGQTRH